MNKSALALSFLVALQTNCISAPQVMNNEEKALLLADQLIVKDLIATIVAQIDNQISDEPSFTDEQKEICFQVNHKLLASFVAWGHENVGLFAKIYTDNLTASQLQEISEQDIKLIALLQKLMGVSEKQSLSEEEITQLDAFCKSSLGSALANQMEEILNQALEILEPKIMELVLELKNALEKNGCPQDIAACGDEDFKTSPGVVA